MHLYRSILSLAAGTAMGIALSAVPAAAQASFACPAEATTSGNQSVIEAALPKGDALDNRDALVSAVSALQAEGISAPDIVNGLIASYCPVVAEEDDLSDMQKTQAVNGFARRVTGIVYNLGSADAVILDVAFAPDILDSIDEKARQAGVSPEAWVRDIVEIELSR